MSDSAGPTSASSLSSSSSASSSASNSKPAKADKRTALNDSALHVFKGALVTVLGASASVTTSVEFVGKEQACLTITWSGDNISDEQKFEIQTAANEMIHKNVAITHTPMSRKAAEDKYRAHPVNHTFIYDKFPVPDHVSELKILEIAEWNVNACSFEGHCKTTGELKALKILKQKRRGKQNEYEFEFCVGDKALQQLQKEGNAPNAAPIAAAADSASASASALTSSADGTSHSKSKSKNKGQIENSKTEQKDSEDWKSVYRPTDATHASTEILQEMVAPFIKALASSHDAAGLHAILLDEKKLHSLLSAKLLPTVEQRLLLYGNSQYAKGFQSKAYTQPTMQSLLSEGRK